MPGKGAFSDKYSAFRRSEPLPAPGGSGGGQWQHGTLTAADVAGAQPRSYEQFTRKGPYAQPTLAKVFGEAGMQPRKFTPKNPRGMPDLKLDISDIPGAHPASDAKNWHFHSPRGTNPLDPQYKLPSAKEAPAPAPKFLRDTLDVSDIEGAQAKPDAWEQRPLRSVECSDIPGAAPAVPRQRQASVRNPLDCSDICINDPTPQQKHQQLMGARQAQQGSTPRAGGLGPGGPAGGARAASAPPCLSDVGVVKSMEWRRQHFEAMREQGEAVRAARAEADGTLDARAPEVASTSALSALLKGFKTLDRDRSGRLQAGEFAAVIGEASLGLTHGEVSKLVGGLRDPDNNCDYRAFMGKLFSRAQQHRVQQARRSGDGGGGGVPGLRPGPAHLGGTHAPEPLRRGGRPAAQQAQQEELQLPNWAVARQRRLSTAVAVMLNQQPAATAAEAASVVVPQQWQYKSPRRFSMHAPDPSPADRSLTASQQQARQAGGSPGAAGGLLDAETEALLQQAGNSRPGGRSGRSMSVAFLLPKADKQAVHATEGRPELHSSPHSSPGAGVCSPTGAPAYSPAGAAANCCCGHSGEAVTAGEEGHHSLGAAPHGKPSMHKSRSCSCLLPRSRTPGSPAALGGGRERGAHAPGSGMAGQPGTGRPGGDAGAALPPSRHAAVPGQRNQRAATPAPGMPGWARMEAGRAATAAATMHGPGACGSPSRVLPALLSPVPLQALHSAAGAATPNTGRLAVMEHASRQQQRLQEDIDLVRSLN